MGAASAALALVFHIPEGLPRWPGETVAVLAGGPSLSQEIADLCRGKCRAIAINRCGVPPLPGHDRWVYAPWADILHAHDRWFWENHPSALDFPGVKTTGEAPITGEIVLIKMAPKNINGRMATPFADPLRPIHAGRDSGYQAAQLAALLGAGRVLLLGFDARPTGRWHGGYGRRRSPEMHMDDSEDSFDFHITAHRRLAPIMQRLGCEVINCTPGSAIDAYPPTPLEAAL